LDYRLAQPPANKKTYNEEMDTELERKKKKDIFFFLNLYLEMTGWNSYNKSHILERLERLGKSQGISISEVLERLSRISEPDFQKLNSKMEGSNSPFSS